MSRITDSMCFDSRSDYFLRTCSVVTSVVASFILFYICRPAALLWIQSDPVSLLIKVQTTTTTINYKNLFWTYRYGQRPEPFREFTGTRMWRTRNQLGIVPRIILVLKRSPQFISPAIQLIQTQNRPLTVTVRMMALMLRRILDTMKRTVTPVKAILNKNPFMSNTLLSISHVSGFNTKQANFPKLLISVEKEFKRKVFSSVFGVFLLLFMEVPTRVGNLANFFPLQGK